MFNFGFKRRNNGLPKQGLLFRAKAPNSDNLLNDESTASLETLLDAGYALPVSVYAAVGGVGPWFSLDGESNPVSITRLMSDILADPTINQYHIGASVRGGVWVHDPYTVWDVTIVKSQRYAKQTPFYSSTPTAYFNGVSIAGSTSFDSGVLGTNPGQWVLAHQGLPGDPMTLVNAGVDQPAIEGARLEWTTENSPELIANAADRELSSITGWWNKSSAPACDIAGGSLVFTNAVATHGINRNTTGGILAVGKKYVCTYTVASISSGGVRAYGTGFIAEGPIHTTAGTYSDLCTFTSMVGIFSVGANTNAIIDNISIKELLPTWQTTYTDGTPICPTTSQLTRTFDAGFTTAVTGTTHARYDRSNPLLMPGMLSEPARTNYCLWSNDLSNAYWTKTNITREQSSSVLAPDWTLTANKLIVVGSGSNAYVKSGNLLLTTGAWTVSRYVKAGNISFCTLGVHGLADAFFDIANNLTSFTGSGAVSAKITDVGNGWKRIEATWNTIYAEYYIYFAVATSLSSQANIAGTYLYSWGHQVELGPFATSPIVTGATTISRAGTVSSWPTLGKIRSNNMAFRLTVVPRAGGQNPARIFSIQLNVTNYVSVMFDASNIRLFSYIEGVPTTVVVPYIHVKDTPVELLITKSTIAGVSIAYRTYSGSWSIWQSSSFTTSDFKSNWTIGQSYEIGSLVSVQQFTGNISELDTLLIPSNITDPLAWAKAQWGIA